MSKILTALGAATFSLALLFSGHGYAQTISQPAGCIAGVACPSNVHRGYLSGLTLSTAGSSATFSVAAGEAADGSTADEMVLASALSKTTSAWAVGTGHGALDTGAVATSTWYHVFLIERLDTSVVDVLVSLSAATPTMPTGYTISRRIGAMRTNGSSQWTKFVQLGDTFLWDAAVGDKSSVTIGTASTLAALTVPTGVQVDALISATVSNAGSAVGLLITSPDLTAPAANTPGGNYTVTSVVAAVAGGGGCPPIRTDTSGQVRVVSTTASSAYSIATQGYVDRRGRDS